MIVSRIVVGKTVNGKNVIEEIAGSAWNVIRAIRSDDHLSLRYRRPKCSNSNVTHRCIINATTIEIFT